MAGNAASDIDAFVNKHWVAKKAISQIGETSYLLQELLGTGMTDASGRPTPNAFGGMIEGGTQIKRSLRFARTQAKGSMSGYDTLDTDPNRKYDFALYDWSTYYVAYPESLDEKLAARGSEQVINKIVDDLDGLTADMLDLIATGIYGSAAARIGHQSKGLHGLRELCTTNREWGGLTSNADAESWWQPGFYDATAYTTANLEDPTHANNILALIRNIINDTKHAGKRPTHLFTSQAVYDMVEATMVYQKMYSGTAKTADIGYEYLSYRGVKIVAEDADYMPDDYHMFAVNLGKAQGQPILNIKGRKGAFFMLTSERKPTNQLATIRFLIAQCALYADQPRLFGMYTGLGNG